MKSVSKAVPVGVRNRVRSTFVPSTYERSSRAGPVGVMRHTLPPRRSRSPAKREGLSKRGQHSQSREPSRAISAADRPSPMTA